MQDRKRLEEGIDSAEKVRAQTEDIDTLFELAREGEEILEDIEKELKTYEEHIAVLETEMLLSGDNDKLDAIITIHPGAGGTESQDWAEMLLKMYLRFAERKNWKAKVISESRGQEAGIKSATIEVIAANAVMAGCLVAKVKLAN